MSKKSKSQSNPMAELNFIASVQLEEAVMMVGDIADKHHQVTLTEVSENEFKFRIDYLPNQTKEGEIWGTLQRWQGTDTKIDASGYVLRLSDENEPDSNETQGGAIALIPLFGGLALILNGIWLLGILAILVAALLIFAMTFLQKEKDDKSTVSFRARDYLLQRIIDTFKTDEELELYVPEISRQEQAPDKS